jgi:hypothetical protein
MKDYGGFWAATLVLIFQGVYAAKFSSIPRFSWLAFGIGVTLHVGVCYYALMTRHFKAKSVILERRLAELRRQLGGTGRHRDDE